MRLERASAMLDTMSAKCRRVFLLRVIEGCTYAEIAERLNISAVAVEKQLLRGYEICAAWSEEGETRTRRGTGRR
jgi:RNA polymerase sigma-70 factor (ECF subfamily)